MHKAHPDPTRCQSFLLFYIQRQVGSSPEKNDEATQKMALSERLFQNCNSEAATAEVQHNTAEFVFTIAVLSTTTQLD